MRRVVIMLLAGVLVAISALVAGVAIPKAAATPGSNDYPSNLRTAPIDSIVDPWNFYNRECTSWVAWRLNNDNKVGFTNQYLQTNGARWGNAADWGAAAGRAHLSVNSTPAVGSVAWWGANTLDGGYNVGSSGHVAWVRSVNGASIVIEEYNQLVNGRPDGAYHTRTIKLSSTQQAKFIHIKDMTVSAPVPAAVSGLVAHPHASRVNLSWNASSNATSYQVQRSGKTATVSGTSYLSWLTSRQIPR